MFPWEGGKQSNGTTETANAALRSYQSYASSSMGGMNGNAKFRSPLTFYTEIYLFYLNYFKFPDEIVMARCVVWHFLGGRQRRSIRMETIWERVSYGSSQCCHVISCAVVLQVAFFTGVVRVQINLYSLQLKTLNHDETRLLHDIPFIAE